MKYKAAVFDMDGTILNTSEDLTDSLNWAFEQTGHRHDFTVDDVRQFFGSGAHVAIQRALIIEKGNPYDVLESIGGARTAAEFGVDEDEVNRIQEIYSPHYTANCAVKTGPYKEIPEVIRKLRSSGVRCAVVSNKPDDAVQKLCIDYFDGLFDYSAGEMENVRRKPAPDMTAKCLKNMNVAQKDAVYIGDTEIDLQTAANSGLDCISVLWGFRSRQFLEAHGAKHIAKRPEEIADYIL